MLKTATSTSQPLEIAIELEKMAQTVLLIGEWLLKQQQQLFPATTKTARKATPHRRAATGD
jgi:hypothetical protein